MNNHIYIFILTLAFVFSSCSKEAEQTTSNGKEVSITASIGPSADSKAEFTDNNDGTLKASWSLSDAILVCDNTDAASNEQAIFTTTGASGATASFSGTLTKLANHHNLTAYYPSNVNVTLDGNNITLSRDYSTQAGTLEYVQNNALMMGSSTFKEGQALAFTFDHQMAVFKITLTMPEDATISKLTLSSNDRTLENKYNDDETTYGVGYGDIVVNFDSPKTLNAGETFTTYVLIPQSAYDVLYAQYMGTLYKLNGLSIMAENSNASKVYIASMSNTATIMAGKMYRINKTLISSCRIGDYLFSDGSWGPISAKPSGSSVIGVIFQNRPSRIGNSTIMAQNGSSQCVHGLALALNEFSDKIWMSGSASVYGDTYLVSDGVAAYNDIYGYSYSYGPSSPTVNLPSNASKYPAMAACMNYTPSAPSTCSRWFLPSIGQWVDILNNLGGSSFGSGNIFTKKESSTAVLGKLNSSISAVGGTSFSPESYYWTSTQKLGGDFYTISMRSVAKGNIVYVSDALPANMFIVRPVIAF